MANVNLENGFQLQNYRLGLDIGSNSIGWAAVDEEGKKILSGVRIFPSGFIKEKGDNSPEKSPAADRRLARQTRRQGERRRRRWKSVAFVLKDAGLLSDDTRNIDPNPYALRARALSSRLEPFEVGRALYHLQKRRGFKSSLKDLSSEDDKELGAVKGAISNLEHRIHEEGKLTLGELLSSVNGSDERLRSRYLGRDMIKAEFDLIWEKQKDFHPKLMTQDVRERLAHAIFYQRPLKPQDSKIGACELEEGERRAPRALWEYQQFRLLQELNNLRIIHPTGAEESLSPSQYEQIKTILSTSKTEVKFDALRKKINLASDCVFNLEGGDRPKIATQLVEATLYNHFRQRWNHEKDSLRRAWNVFVDCEHREEFLDQCLANGWSFSEDDVKMFSSLLKKVPDSYGSYSLKAIENLLPYLEEGLLLHQALEAAYPDRKKEPEVLDYLPAVNAEKIINPNVRRALSETRKVVNMLIREHGKPKEIVVELARENKGTMATRARQNAKMRTNEKMREKAAIEIQKLGLSASPMMIRKYQLWDECKDVCVYCGKRLGCEAVLHSGNIQIEHILPYSRSMDNSYLNVTLSHVACNQDKNNRTPYEAYSGNAERYEELLQRVKHTAMPWEKKRRFSLKEIPDDFTSRQLVDTSHAARELTEYLKHLGEKHVRIRTTKGGVTANLRHCFGLNKILEKSTESRELSGKKNRLDHRHHAVDAIAIALSTPHHVRLLGQEYSNPNFTFPEPWKGFHGEATRSIKSINVSHRVEHKLNAGFSKGTNYGLKHVPLAGEKVFVQRVSVEALTASQAERICDPVVRNTVRMAIEAAGDIKKNKDWHVGLQMPSANGNGPKIQKVRIFEDLKNLPKFERNGFYRHVQTENNHHLALYCKTENGKRIYSAWVKTRLEAMQNQAHNQRHPDQLIPIVSPTHPTDPDSRLVLWIMKNDSVLWTFDDGEEILYRVQSISGPPKAEGMDISLRLISEAMLLQTQEPYFVRVRSISPQKIEAANQLRIQKVTVDPIGRIWPCNDVPND